MRTTFVAVEHEAGLVQVEKSWEGCQSRAFSSYFPLAKNVVPVCTYLPTDYRYILRDWPISVSQLIPKHWFHELIINECL